ncbi:hypothetical protein GOP47_0025258 [Adiantum capillus-veneris]|uniref:Uncharacterized protein n=1 Tax=Adiantum capillus-veneris TaxID=13818 RepID=A0A9D4U082_ADICA|nr:hypothetical protein GOP47_0025258 [Adiantum capillus-veneris]
MAVDFAISALADMMATSGAIAAARAAFLVAGAVNSREVAVAPTTEGSSADGVATTTTGARLTAILAA